MDKRFLRAFLTPSRTVVEGYALYPWCLKYRIWLQAIESPLLADDAPIEPSDLILALQICSEGGVGKARPRDLYRGLRMTLSRERFEEACRAFLAYCNNDGSWPKFYEKKNQSGGGAVSTICWELAVIANLVKHGVSYEAALQMPEPRAVWLSTAFLVNDGADLHILSSDDEALIDSLSQVKEPPKETQ